MLPAMVSQRTHAALLLFLYHIDFCLLISSLPRVALVPLAAALLGKYSTFSEHKELYVSSDNYIDVDRRSRIKIGGIFIDGLGAQVRLL